MTSQHAAITLNLIPGLGSVRIRRLMEQFGSPEIILHADARLLMQVRGIGPELARGIASWRTTTDAAREVELADRAGVRIVTLFDAGYPAALRTINDPPVVLYCRGSWTRADDRRALAIVGSRLATPYGRLTASRFARELAGQGVTIVSGLAKGVDTEAHRAALDAGGRTIAVIGSGLNHLYPADNEGLAAAIADGRGAVVSEFPMNLRPGKSTFPMRNRIISGWSKATLVIEAPLRSGSLITAHQAVEQGRLVFAVPGPVDRPQSEGCHELIRDGAILAARPSQILDDCGWNDLTAREPELALEDTASPQPALPSMVLSDDERAVHEEIVRGTSTIDALCAATGMAASGLMPILARLQIGRFIVPAEGGVYLPAR